MLASAAALALGAIALLLIRRGTALARAPRLRVAAVAASQPGQAGAAAGPPEPFVALAAYAPLVQRAAAQGARLVVLPADHVQVDAETYTPWLAQVRHWARQGQVWLVLGYALAGPDGGSRMLAIDPVGNIRAGCDRRGPGTRGGGVSAHFGPRLELAGWQRTASPGGGLRAEPGPGGSMGARQRLGGWAAALAGGTIVHAAAGGCWIAGPTGRLLARQANPAGPVVLVADVPVPPRPVRRLRPGAG